MFVFNKYDENQKFNGHNTYYMIHFMYISRATQLKLSTYVKVMLHFDSEYVFIYVH